METQKQICPHCREQLPSDKRCLLHILPRTITAAPFRGCPRGNSYEHCNHTGAKLRYDAYRRNLENQNEIAQKEIDQLEKSRKENRSQLHKAINRQNKAIDRFESINADINKLNRDWESREKRLNKLRQRIQDGKSSIGRKGVENQRRQK